MDFYLSIGSGMGFVPMTDIDLYLNLLKDFFRLKLIAILL
jgi:hypothetical protein